jgi:hypothetical protein
MSAHDGRESLQIIESADMTECHGVPEADLATTKQHPHLIRTQVLLHLPLSSLPPLSILPNLSLPRGHLPPLRTDNQVVPLAIVGDVFPIAIGRGGVFLSLPPPASSASSSFIPLPHDDYTHDILLAIGRDGVGETNDWVEGREGGGG